MFDPHRHAVRYTNRYQVLHHLSILMRKKLLPEERRLILLHCGIGTEAPLPFTVLSSRLSLGNAADTERRYIQAIEKVRTAIPKSKLSFWVASFG